MDLNNGVRSTWSRSSQLILKHPFVVAVAFILVIEQLQQEEALAELIMDEH